MRTSRFRFTTLGLMGMVVLAALAFAGYREWDKRYGSGEYCWRRGLEFEGLARFDLKKAREYRECPRQHTPWDARFQCPGCIDCPFTLVYDKPGKPPTRVFNLVPDSAPGRVLSKRYLDRHEEVAREYEAEAALSRRLVEKFSRAASRPDGPKMTFTPEEWQMIAGSGLSRKYQYDWY